MTITSFTDDGELTWTNSVADATYRVEWAGTADGPWSSMDALTNLTSITTTSNIVRVKVPAFYRVIWLDAPEHAGTWDYRAYATNGTLIVTGWVTLSAETDPDSHYPIRGNWAFFRAVAPEFPIAHPPFGASEFHSDLTGLYPFNSVLHLFRSPLVADGPV